jgi:hypothetical protein
LKIALQTEPFHQSVVETVLQVEESCHGRILCQLGL